MNTTASIPEGWFSWSSMWLMALWMPIGVIGAPGNCIVMWLTVTREQLRTKTANWFIFNLSLCDFLLMVMVGLHGVAVQFPDTVFCKQIAFYSGLCAISGFYIPPFIALHRYVFLCHKPAAGSRDYRSWFSKRNIVIMNAACWMIGFVTLAPFLILHDTTLGLIRLESAA